MLKILYLEEKQHHQDDAVQTVRAHFPEIKITPVENTDNAFRKLREDLYDLVIADINGVALLQRMKEANGYGTPVIFYSDAGWSDVREALKAAGFHDFPASCIHSRERAMMDEPSMQDILTMVQSAFRGCVRPEWTMKTIIPAQTPE